MFRQRIFCPIKNITARAFSSGEKIIDLKIDNEGIGFMKLQRRPVNSINLEIIQEAIRSVKYLESEKCKGLIITSGIPKIFSAGVDLNELHKPSRERLSLFWRSLQDLFLTLYTSELTTTAAINGYTAAGGCVLTLMCDYRVMLPKCKMGLNDTAVGIVPAWWIRELMIRAMGLRQAEIALTSSKMYTTEEALKAQMIDEIATDQEDALEKCKKFIRLYDNIPRDAYSATKRLLRASAIKYIEDNREKDIEMFVENTLKPYTQEQIAKYVEQLKQK